MTGRPTAEKHKREDAALAGIEQEALHVSSMPRCCRANVRGRPLVVF
jgi:hypothetical protein